jgi:hypothetical protein
VIFSFVINIVNVAQTEASNGRLKTKSLAHSERTRAALQPPFFCVIAGHAAVR